MDKETWIIILVVFLYLLQAVAGGLIARSRGKSFWIWFGVCFMMIFPIGFHRHAALHARRQSYDPVIIS